MNRVFIAFCLYIWLMIVVVIFQCIMFSKMGLKWWKSLVPVYRQWLLLERTGLPKGWAFVTVFPILHFSYVVTFGAAVNYRLFLSFGATPKVALLFMLFPFIGSPVIAISSAEYEELEWS